MLDSNSTEIVKRFFSALDQLKVDKRIRGRQTFSTRYGINKRNMYKCINDPSSRIFEPSWMQHICKDYGISPQWLLLGVGDMYNKEA